MKVLATVLMTTAVMAGCSMPSTQRNNAVEGNQSEGKRTPQQQTSEMPQRASDSNMTSPTGSTQRSNATEGNRSEGQRK